MPLFTSVKKVVDLLYASATPNSRVGAAPAVSIVDANGQPLTNLGNPLPPTTPVAEVGIVTAVSEVFIPTRIGYSIVLQFSGNTGNPTKNFNFYDVASVTPSVAQSVTQLYKYNFGTGDNGGWDRVASSIAISDGSLFYAESFGLPFLYINSSGTFGLRYWYVPETYMRFNKVHSEAIDTRIAGAGSTTFTYFKALSVRHRNGGTGTVTVNGFQLAAGESRVYEFVEGGYGVGTSVAVVVTAGSEADVVGVRH